MDQLASGIEEQRRAILEQYRILDTPPEATFDRIVEIVAAALGTPMAMITLVDRERSWYKAEVGFGIRELPRQDNMCDDVIRHDDVLVISDSSEAPGDIERKMSKAGLRFYAGAPLKTHEGISIGTLCAMDRIPRRINEQQRLILGHLAETVIDELELRLTARKIADADAELRRLNDALQVANRNKSEFLASMSHELRTPLNGILGASELLAHGLFGDLNLKQLEYVQDINRSGEHLLRLINDVLDLSRIEAGQLELRREIVDVGRFMDQCVGLIRGAAAARSQDILVLAPVTGLCVHADERRLTQVACNLLSNALKFTPNGGRIRFSAEHRQGTVVFAIEDQGPGIPADLHERIFEQFFRIASDREGTGLGLPLARQLIEAHGGSIWLESAMGRGSRFYFSLPAEHS